MRAVNPRSSFASMGWELSTERAQVPTVAWAGMPATADSRHETGENPAAVVGRFIERFSQAMPPRGTIAAPRRS